MFATFYTINDNNAPIKVFGTIYIYVFVTLFIYVVLSLFIAIIMDAYEVVKVRSQVFGAALIANELASSRSAMTKATTRRRHC